MSISFCFKLTTNLLHLDDKPILFIYFYVPQSIPIDLKSDEIYVKFHNVTNGKPLFIYYTYLV